MKGKGWAILIGAGVVIAVFALVGMMDRASRLGGGPGATEGLELRLQATLGVVAAETPPLRVFAMMPEVQGGPWRWKVEATLRPGYKAADPETARVVERAKGFCLSTPVGGKAPGGLLFVLHQPGGPDWTRTYDAEGRPR